MFLFVGIPLPGTGAWTGTLAASLLDMDFKKSIIAVMAGVATSEVRGVAGMSGGFAGGIAEVFGRRNLSKGVKVVTKNESTTVDLYVVVKYGYRIPDLAYEIQETVKSTIESLSGIVVDAVNIHIQGIDYSEDSNKIDESESGT